MKKIKTYRLTALLLSFLILFIFSGLSFSQEIVKSTMENELQTDDFESGTLEFEAAEPQTQWLWGEVVSLDVISHRILVKYLDYETDSEQDVSIYTETDTIYENVNTLEEINPGDTVSIDYVIAAEGKNIAQLISVEKLETQSEEVTIPAESSISSE